MNPAVRFSADQKQTTKLWGREESLSVWSQHGKHNSPFGDNKNHHGITKEVGHFICNINININVGICWDVEILLLQDISYIISLDISDFSHEFVL